MRSGRTPLASRLRVALPACLAFAALVVAAPSASAATVQIAGDPLTIWVGDHGSFQERVKGNSDNSFYPRSSEEGSAGFALAFPSGQVGSFSTLSGTVWGWASGNPNPDFG